MVPIARFVDPVENNAIGPLSSGVWPLGRKGWVRAALRILPAHGWLHGLGLQELGSRCHSQQPRPLS